MNGYKQIRTRLVRNLHAPAMVHVVIAATNQHRLHAVLGIDTRREFARHGQCDIFLARPATADGARIMTTVTGVHRHHDVATRLIRFRCTPHRLQVAAALEVDDETIAVLRIRARGETARAYVFIEVQHDAQLTVGTHAAANTFYRANTGRHALQ